jgi:hypothetical protein
VDRGRGVEPGPIPEDIAQPTDGTGSTARPGGVPASARWLVRGFLAAFLLCSVFGLELWPLTGFRLFSRVRHQTRFIWTADAVLAGGREVQVVFMDLPRAYQGFGLIMNGFRHLSPGDKRASCEAWLTEVRRVDGQADALRLYRVTWTALPRKGARPARSPPRKLDYVCR